MKTYRVSLEIVASPTVTRLQLADLLGVIPSALAEERVKRSILWRYEPSTGQTGELAERLQRLAEEVRPRQPLAGSRAFKRVSLGIDVLYDTASCTVVLPLNRLVYGPRAIGTSLSDLSSVELRCVPSAAELAPSEDEDRLRRYPDLTRAEMQEVAEAWRGAGEPCCPRARVPLLMDQPATRAHGPVSSRRDRTDANEYIVSLDAITTGLATQSEVADVLGLPSEAFTSRSMEDRPGALWWRCELEAPETVGLAQRIRFLASAVRPRRAFEDDGEINRIFLSIGVICEVGNMETCPVRLPVSSLRSLTRKLFVFDVEVSCYPGDNETD